ncbi:hypothetical protein L9F63_002303 [Diploptera punctata]|uniref:Uncharacterized protein n=1 Tax=Diploptera punctata TaxID=6984 RepID=A0AAD8EI43_DIPPU|nr:hypothetical protein L9F63_002303 [Diploptera punctata]
MVWKDIFLFRNPTSQLKIIVIIFLFSAIFCPVSPRPSENPSHSVSREITDVNQQSANRNNEEDEFMTEIETSEILEVEEYPQDAPMEDNRGPRKQDNRHFKSHHIKNGKKTATSQQQQQQQPVVQREPVETNDSVPETLQDFNLDDSNDTANGDRGENSTTIDESILRASQKNRER